MRVNALTRRNKIYFSAPLELQQPTPEYIQRKIYFLVDHLRKFHAELPE